jgi:1,4-alpha-glucan branching enzyme
VHIPLTTGDGRAYELTGWLFQGYETFGFNVKENGDILYREWAPSATEAHLIGDFSKRYPSTSTNSGLNN